MHDSRRRVFADGAEGVRSRMSGVRWRPIRTVWLLLLSAIPCLASAPGLAVPVTDFITVQPVDVCSSTGTSCAPINNMNQTAVTNPGTTQIGFIGSGGINITNAMWNQIGVNVTFLPLVQENSTASQVITVTSCAANGTDCQSPQFQVVSDQPGISMGQAPMPTPPLNSSPTTINMFFVNSLVPPTNQPGLLYGFAWINSNGVAIGKNTFSPPFPLTPRFDTLAHELGHILDLDHATFGAGVANNLMTAGNVRTEPTSAANALSQLAAGTADQLNAMQQTQVLKSGFMNPIPNVDTQITDPKGGDDFSVSFANAGRPNESLTTLILTAPAGFQLDPDSFRQLHLPGDTAGITVIPSFSGCTSEGDRDPCQTLMLSFLGQPFVLGDMVDYTVGVCQQENDHWGEGDCSPVSSNDLAGGTYTYQFNDGYQTTSLLELIGTNQLDAKSWNPDPDISAEIYNEALLAAANVGRLPCNTAGSCPNPLDTGIEDGSPVDEGGQLPVSEPAPLLILLAGLGLALFVYRRISRRPVTV